MKQIAFLSIAVVIVLFLAAELVLLAMPYLRQTKAGRRAENSLKQTPFYSAIKYLFWRATPGFLRRWAGSSRASKFSDVLEYSANHRQRLSDLAEAKAASALVRRDPDGYELWSTPDGEWWVPTGESGGLFDVLAEQKRGIYDNAQSAIRSGDVVLDCGADVGSFARHALRSGASLVVAIEPGPSAVECLRRNLENEISEGRVTIHTKGLWHREDLLVLSGSGVSRRVVEEPPRRGASEKPSGRGDSDGELRVHLTTIDKIVDELGLKQVDFIKMDIEGAEVPALTGAQSTLAKFRPRLAVAGYHNRGDSETIPRAVFAAWAGYNLQYGRFYTPAWVRPEALFFS